jgi:hypothetical protein
MAGTPSEMIVGYCGLVCSHCGAFRRGRCEGCHSERPMFRGCPVKPCAAGRGYSTCAGCTEFADLRQCHKLHNLISRIVGLIFRSDRIGNLCRIREIGLEAFKAERVADGRKRK